MVEQGGRGSDAYKATLDKKKHEKNAINAFSLGYKTPQILWPYINPLFFFLFYENMTK